MITANCKSEFVTKFTTFWGEPRRAWLTTYHDKGTGRNVSFWGRVMKPSVRTLGGMQVMLIPNNN